MVSAKTTATSFRVSPRFGALFGAVAERERRSLTSMLEALLLDYCEKHGVRAVPVRETSGSGQ